MIYSLSTGKPERVIWFLSALLALSQISCRLNDTPEDAEGPSVRDSLNVTIVENVSPKYAGNPWAIADRTAICSSDGDNSDPRVFRVRDVLPLKADTIAALVYESQEVLICHDGGVVRALGRRGEGPGEFTRLIKAVPAQGDSIAVIEDSRVTFLSTSTGGARTLPISQAANGTGFRFMRSSYALAVLRASDGSGTRLTEGAADLILIDADGQEVQTFSQVDYTSRSDQHTVVMFLWGTGLPTALGGRRYWRISRDTFQLRVFGPNGLERIVRAPGGRREITPELWAVGAELVREELGDDVPSEYLDEIVERPDDPNQSLAPATISIVLGRAGEAWVRIPEGDPRTGSSVWRVFSRDSEWLTDVELPPHFRLVRVEDEVLYGVSTDNFGLERVERITLRRN